MGTQSNAAPVIIKRKKVVSGGGHHGGAWKVAYADFVTAMMAFFMLMWLLNATTEKQRKGIADYFSPTIAVNRISGGGDGAFGGDSVFSENTLPQMGTGASNLRPTEGDKARGDSGTDSSGKDSGQQEEAFKAVEEALLGRGGESDVSEQLLKHVTSRVTDEGLIIEFFDLETARLFREGTDTPSPLLEDLAAMLVDAFRIITNPVAINGHVRSQPVVVLENSVWALSTARAEAMRRLLVRKGLDEDRVSRVTGQADKEPLSENPMALRNNRLEVVLLRTNF